MSRSGNKISKPQGPGRGLPPDLVIFGRSAAMHRVRQELESATQTDVPVMLVGERGTGKETIARWMHFCSPRRNGGFVKLSGLSVPGGQVAHKAGGHDKPAFACRDISMLERVQPAHRGTLFLDEPRALDSDQQDSLLQLLRDAERYPPTQEPYLDVRLVSTADPCLERELTLPALRRDLFYRLNVLTIALPPLRERRRDIPLLADYFARTYSEQLQRPALALSRDSIAELTKYWWPGNIRELQQVIKRHILFGANERLHLPPEGPRELPDIAETRTRSQPRLKDLVCAATKPLERQIIRAALDAHQWNQRETARALGISYRHLFFKMKSVGLPLAKDRRARQADAAEAIGVGR